MLGKALTILDWLLSHPHGCTVICICCRSGFPEAISEVEIIIQEGFRECFQDEQLSGKGSGKVGKWEKLGCSVGTIRPESASWEP